MPFLVRTCIDIQLAFKIIFVHSIYKQLMHKLALFTAPVLEIKNFLVLKLILYYSVIYCSSQEFAF